MFIEFWKSQQPVTVSNIGHSEPRTAQPPCLSSDEQNALWYVGGYILRAIKKKIKRSKCVDKEMMYILEAFEEVEIEDDDEDDKGELDSQQWTKLVNRGNLIFCTNRFYTFLATVELSKSTRCF